MRFYKRFSAFLLGTLMLLSMSGCGDTEETAKKSDSKKDSSAKNEASNGSGDAFSLFSEDGSAGELEGTTVVVTIFTDDGSTSWAKADDEIYDVAYNDLDIAAKWIEEQGKQFGKSNKFIYDWDENEDLFYEAELDIKDVAGTVDDNDDINPACWEYIDKNVDSAALLKKYKADNIVYMFLFNTPFENEVTSCTTSFYEDMEYPYEFCLMFMSCDDDYESPGAFAHEIFHTFGAPDLYCTDEDYGITQEYVDTIEKENLNDIMRIHYDPVTEELNFDEIVNEITDITAYYIGWADSSETVEKWGFYQYE